MALDFRWEAILKVQGDYGEDIWYVLGDRTFIGDKFERTDLQCVHHIYLGQIPSRRSGPISNLALVHGSTHLMSCNNCCLNKKVERLTQVFSLTSLHPLLFFELPESGGIRIIVSPQHKICRSQTHCSSLPEGVYEQ